MSEPTLSEPVMGAFFEEFRKVAALPQGILKHLTRVGTRRAMASGVGSGLGLGLGAGALVGGVSGGKGAYEAALERGAGMPGAALSALGGGLGGAIRGAGKGAVIGAGSGLALGALTPKTTLSMSKTLQKDPKVLGSLNNFGQRQVHSLTGWMPGGAAKSVERIGTGAAPVRRELLSELGKATRDPAKIERGVKALRAAEKAQSMGLTSLPGYAKSLKKNGIAPTVEAGLRSQWDASGAKGKALMLGLPAASLASAATAPETEGGQGRAERAGRIIGGTLGGVAAPLSLAGTLALSAGLERGGAVVGRRVDRSRQHAHPSQVPHEPQRPPATEPGDTGQHAVEHVYGRGFNAGGLE